MKNYDWFLQQDLSSYGGQWVAIIDNRIIGNGKDVDTLIKQAKKLYPNKIPFITKVNNQLSVF
ncbi:hypothetical protein HY490_01640 [Candidatus Woesearchaeota archaeon]|nr:hypothetical protein [Candidatus Woesearchaeota archaeon]